MPQWKIYLKWAGDKGFHPHQKIEKGGLVPRIFNNKEDAQKYFDKSQLKVYNDEGWIAEYMIKKVGE